MSARTPEEDPGPFALNGLSIDQLSIDQEGELRVIFDLPVVQTTPQYHQQLQGVRTFDVYKDPELERLCRDLFRAVQERVRRPDPERLAVSCERCRSAACCRNYNVLVREDDVEVLRGALGLTLQAFQETYLRKAVDWAGDYPRQLACDADAVGEKCLFLKPDGEGRMRCSVYAHRPRICRDFDESACHDFEALEDQGSPVAGGPRRPERGQES